MCKAAPPRTTERPPTAAEAKSDKNSKQEVVSYNGVEFEVTDKPELRSTWTQRAIVVSTSVVLGLLFAQGASHSNSGLAVAACVLAGYVFAGTQLASTLFANAYTIYTFILMHQGVLLCLLPASAFSSVAVHNTLLHPWCCLRLSKRYV